MIRSSATQSYPDIVETDNESPALPEEARVERRQPIIWTNVIAITTLHILAFYGLYLCLSSAKWQTNVFAYSLFVVNGLGVTAGAHRLWSHNSYKAKWQLKVILCVLNTMAYMGTIYDWCRDHRVHHKYSDTDADPHNSKRGFFFSHVGWLMCKKHHDVITKGRGISMDDLLDDPIVMFQKRYYYPLVVVFWLIIPTLIPRFFWSETYLNSIMVAVVLRYTITLNVTFSVNSLAHIWGDRPYDKNISPVENWWVILFTAGEGFHNYHHSFPWDYSTSEYGIKYNLTTFSINLFATIGWAYDLKTASHNVIQERRLKTGDGIKMS